MLDHSCNPLYSHTWGRPVKMTLDVEKSWNELDDLHSEACGSVIFKVCC